MLARQSFRFWDFMFPSVNRLGEILYSQEQVLTSPSAEMFTRWWPAGQPFAPPLDAPARKSILIWSPHRAWACSICWSILGITDGVTAKYGCSAARPPDGRTVWITRDFTPSRPI